LSPLHVAARYNQVEICEFLLKQGITPDITESLSLKTPLHIAAYFGHLEVVKVLKKYRANLDINDSISSKPIHYAAMGVNKDLILFFLENQTKPSAQSLFGNILDILIRKKSLELVDFFSNIGGIDCLDSNYFPHSTPERGFENSWSPFHSAAISGQEKIFEMLLHKFPHFICNNKGSVNLFSISVLYFCFGLGPFRGNPTIKKLLNLQKNTDEYRSIFMKENRYETDFPNRKEICNAIRYRDMKKLQDVIEKKESPLSLKEKKRGELRSSKFFRFWKLSLFFAIF